MAKKSEAGRFPYEGVRGVELMRRMAEECDIDSLATLWQLGDPQTSAHLVSIFFDLGDERLARLIAEELLADALPAPSAPR